MDEEIHEVGPALEAPKDTLDSLQPDHTSPTNATSRSKAEKKKRLSAAQAEKEKAIRDACSKKDLGALTSLGSSRDGFINDNLRCLAWPLLLGVRPPESQESLSWEKLPPHPDESQVKLDVDRSFVYYPHNESELALQKRRTELQQIIVETLRRHPFLCYPQGYHDIVQVLLLVLGRERAIPAVARLTLLRVRDFMLPTIAATVSHLKLLPPLLRAADPKLERHVSPNDPSYALAATLTLYAHHIEKYPDIARIYDFLLATEAVIPIYLFASIIINRKSELFEIEPGEPEMLSVLQKLPDPIDWESLIAHTLELFRRYPPESLPGGAWRKVSSYSVLKTTRGPLGVTRQSLDDGAKLFAKHAAQVRMSQRLADVRLKLWQVRRPTGTVGAAILIALVAWSLRNESPVGVLSMLWQRFQAMMW